MLRQIVDAGWAKNAKHAINLLAKLERSGKADQRWADAAALVAVEMYRKYGDGGDDNQEMAL